MRKIILNKDRKGPTCYLAMHERIRMGDLACCHVWMAEWRNANPDKRLVVYFNPLPEICEYSRQIPMEWVFGNSADEIWLRQSPADPKPAFDGWTNVGELYDGKDPSYVHIWDLWRKFLFNRTYDPQIKPPEPVQRLADETMKAYNVPEKFVCLQPLFEAGYHKYRNAPPDWWASLADNLVAMKIPTAIIGPTKYMPVMRRSRKAFHLWERLANPYHSMGVINRAAVHIGGETGLPLWASLFKRPVAFTTRRWGPGAGPQHTVTFDYRPIPYGAPVIHVQLEGNPALEAAKIRKLFEGQTKESTPFG